MSTSYYKYCEKCGAVVTLCTKCSYCKTSLIETDILEPDDSYKKEVEQKMQEEIYSKYKIKESPLYNEEAVKNRKEQEQQLYKKRYENSSTPYTPIDQNLPKCPTCGSTNVNKISGAKKAAGFITVGISGDMVGVIVLRWFVDHHKMLLSMK